MRRFDELFETFPADTPLADPGEKPTQFHLYGFNIFLNLSKQTINITYHVAYALVRATLRAAMDDDGDDDGINETKRQENCKIYDDISK